MENDPKIPQLVLLLFGEHAGVAWPLTPARLKAWSEAFERWEELLAFFDEQAAEMGEPPPSDAIRAEALGWAHGARPDSEYPDNEPDSMLADRSLNEETAGLRIILRKTLALAERAIAAGEVREAVGLAEVYGSASIRLSRLLKLEAVGHTDLKDFFEKSLQAATSAVLAELRQA